MKEIKDIFENKRLSFIEFLHTKDGQFLCGGFTLDPITRKRLNFKFTKSFGWEHLSVSTPTKCPSWDQMCFMKEQFWTDDEACVEYHPKKEDYVNNHNYCLHVWRPYEVELPTPPSIMVGVRNIDDLQYMVDNIEKYRIQDSDIIRDEYCIIREKGKVVH